MDKLIGAREALRSRAALAGGFALAGSSVVAGKILAGLPVFFASAAGAAIAFVVLVPLALREKYAPGALRRALPMLAAQAFFGVALFRVLMLAALSRASASEAGLATSATPAITALLSGLFLRERIRARAGLGIALAVLGMVLLESHGSISIGSGRLLGFALALGAAASESVFNVLSKRQGSSIGPRRTSAIVMAMAAVLLAVLSLATGERVALAEIGRTRALALAYQGVFSSALAYILWYTGIAGVSASTGGAFSTFIPLASFALSIIVLGERPAAAAFAGCAVALLGMLLCALPRRGAAGADGADGALGSREEGAA